MTIGGGLPLVDAQGTANFTPNQTLTSVNIGNHIVTANANDQLIAALASDNLSLITGLTNTHLGVSRAGIAWEKLGEYTYAPGGLAKTGSTLSLWKYKVPAGWASTGAIIVDTTAPSDVFAFTVIRVQNTPNLVFRGLPGDGPIVGGASGTVSLTLGLPGGPTTEHLAFRADGMETDTAPSITPTSGWFYVADRSTGGSGMIYAGAEAKIESTAQSVSAPSSSTQRRSSIGIILAETSLAPVGAPRMIL